MVECPECGSQDIGTDFVDDPETGLTVTMEFCQECGYEITQD